jgi:N-methylhydantoinase B/oxoprolinase/acetone carboxylase alpha subunit
MTDPEVFEQNLPVIVRSFAIRGDSGGAGRWRGGHGTVRKLEFLQPVEAAILSNHRRVAPFGLEGGANGKTGRNAVIRRDGKTESLSGTVTIDLDAGDVVVIETPGGGGFGRKQ